jgi:pSer/pThr/pTyr-binding forkhead associated (FHA) protein
MARPGLLPNGRPIPALLITSGPRTGERHMLFNGFLIGKQPGCHLQIEDGYTSSQHAQIGMDANGFCKLFDRGSTNGTYVNGVRITESALQHGLVIRIGSTEMRFLAE